MSAKSIQTWQETFGTVPVKIVPNVNPLQVAWEEMGTVYGKVQLEKQRYKKAGLTQAVAEIDSKMSEKQKDLENRTMDLIGYVRVDKDAQTNLRSVASSENLYLNVYKLHEYKKIPPINVAQAIMEARQYFDDVEIWAIEDVKFVRPMKDPAVIGYVKIGYERIPYLIATWGDDISPEDLVEKPQLSSGNKS